MKEDIEYPVALIVRPDEFNRGWQEMSVEAGVYHTVRRDYMLVTLLDDGNYVVTSPEAQLQHIKKDRHPWR